MVDVCKWKLINPSEFILGMPAERCGQQADVKVLRPQRKTDLFLCEEHLNDFVEKWGLHYRLEILCREGNWNKANGIDWDDV